MTDQPESSSETPEEPQSDEAVSETPADTPTEEIAATEAAEAETAVVDAEADAPDEATAPDEADVAAEATDSETAAQPVGVADADGDEPIAEAADSETAESDQTELTLGSGAPAEEEVERPAPVIRGKIDKFGVAMGTGRRKTSVARVRIKAGSGEMTINGRSFEEYFCIERDRRLVEAPLRTTETFGKVDIWVRVGGGGTTGQTGAVVLGIARALQAMDPTLHYSLADNGYLTRDGRMVERKKYGFKKARKSFQFSKR